MIQRHKNRLLSKELTTLGFIWVKELEKNKIILNCKKLEWDLLYTNIILQLTNEGLIELEDSKKIDFITDYNNESKLKEEDTKQELKDMVLNRNRQLQLHLQKRR
jgi:hypothetical protein